MNRPTPPAPSPDTDVVDLLSRDHRQIEEMFRELENGGARGAPERRRLVDRVITELVQLSVVKELHLYPAVRTYLDDGDAVADREISEHARAEHTMKELEDVDPGDSRFEPLLSRLMTETRAHIEDAEKRLFPQLVSRMTKRDRRDLGRRVEKAKRTAPTRPHPGAPDAPPVNRIVDPGLGLVDRLRDAFTERRGQS